MPNAMGQLKNSKPNASLNLGTLIGFQAKVLFNLHNYFENSSIYQHFQAIGSCDDYNRLLYNNNNNNNRCK